MIVEQIQTLCEEAKITLAQLEKKLAFGNGTIRRWNENFPSIDKVLKVANYFEVRIDCLIQNTERRD